MARPASSAASIKHSRRALLDDPHHSKEAALQPSCTPFKELETLGESHHRPDFDYPTTFNSAPLGGSRTPFEKPEALGEGRPPSPASSTHVAHFGGLPRSEEEALRLIAQPSPPPASDASQLLLLTPSLVVTKPTRGPRLAPAAPPFSPPARAFTTAGHAIQAVLQALRHA